VAVVGMPLEGNRRRPATKLEPVELGGLLGPEAERKEGMTADAE
jgi:hypothetical protein